MIKKRDLLIKNLYIKNFKNKVDFSIIITKIKKY